MAKSHLPGGTLLTAKEARAARNAYDRGVAAFTRHRAPTLIQLGRSVGAEEKAIFHNLSGAGRSHVLRPFMDLTDDDQDHLTTQLAEGIDRLLAGER